MSVTYVALLRGINVGRAKRIAMADLRGMLETLGFTDVKTLGQSGNVIFSAGRDKPEAMEEKIAMGIKSSFGMVVAVMVRTAAELAVVVDENPFVKRGVPVTDLHVAFLSSNPSAAHVKALDAATFTPDEFAFGTRAVYVRLHNGVMGSTLPDWDKVLGVRATQRNWNTTTKLRDLSSGPSKA
jgi:uncharacterized protein (DUF1697 family)